MTGNQDLGDSRPIRETDATYTRRRLLVAGVAAAVPLAIWAKVAAGSPPDSGSSASSTSNPTRPDLVTVPSSTVAGDSNALDEPGFGPITQDLELGMVSDDVARLQERLTELNFDPGPIDGYFGESTLR